MHDYRWSELIRVGIELIVGTLFPCCFLSAFKILFVELRCHL